MPLRPRLARPPLHPSIHPRLATALHLGSLLALPELSEAGNLIRVPDDFPTVSAAVAVAVPGQTVGVRAGTYPGEFVPKTDVDVLGGYDPTFTIRDPEQFETILVGSPRVIQCDLCTAGSNTLIDGFTMQAPPGNLEGAIAYIRGASPTISHCRFENAVGFRGAAMSLVNSASQLYDNVFIGNACNEVGGALAAFSCTQARIVRCHFQGNTSGTSGAGIFFNACVGIEVQNSTFSLNNSTSFGGGILVQQSSITISGSVLWENVAVNGAAIGVYSNEPCFITSCTMALNHGNGAIYASTGVQNTTMTRSIVAQSTGAGVAAATDAQVANSCNDVWGNNPDYSGVTPGNDTFSLDPLFCDADAGVFTLVAASPCAAANSPGSCGLIGALDIGCGGGLLRVPDDYATVGAALEAAAVADTVAVAEGHYLEHVTLKDRVVLLGGYRNDFAVRDPVAYPSVLDAGGFLSPVVAQNGESSLTVLDGFVITGGNRPGGYGGGIDCFNASPTISHNVFLNNRAKQGGAIACRAGSVPLVTGNLLIDNHALDNPGGAIYLESSALIVSNTLDGNRGPSASGIAVTNSARPAVSRNIVVNGSGIGIYAENGALPALSCNDVWMNIGGNYFGIPPGPNSLSLDPLFCPGDEHLLSEASPCAPPNSPAACGLIGAGEVGCLTVAVADPKAVPAEPWLGRVAPNPTAGPASLVFGLPGAAPVMMAVHDAAGRRVRTLIDATAEPGEHRVLWDGRTDRGGQAASGIYFFRLLISGRSIGERKLVYLH